MYLVIELQTVGDTISTLTNQYSSKNLAEQKYFAILSAAAISEVDIHAAVIMDPCGNIIKNYYYRHNED